jgi:hypothetical protein
MLLTSPGAGARASAASQISAITPSATTSGTDDAGSATTSLPFPGRAES